MKFRFADLAGRYRLRLSQELLAFIEQAFVEPAPPRERLRVRAEAVAEAQAAELEISASGSLVSRAGAQEFYRVQLTPGDGWLDELRFEKAPGQSVRLMLRETGELIALQPGKPPAIFERF
jgi:hypothetical protein